jgi:hypothetical protein
VVFTGDASTGTAGPFVSWKSIRKRWRQAFKNEPRKPRHSRPLVSTFTEPGGIHAFVSIQGSRSEEASRLAVMTLVHGRWLIRHIRLARLPEGLPRPTDARRPRKASPKAPVVTHSTWAAVVLAVALVAIALLGTINEGGRDLQTTAAILAVFLGAVATLNRDLGTWFHGAEAGAVTDVTLTFAGALVVSVGAAFLVT